MITLREDQNEALVDILGAWLDDVQRPAVVCPTGWGKTILFAKLCSFLARRGDRPLVLVARDELVTQSVAKLLAIDPHLAVGVIRGQENELRGEVTVASVQTLSRERRLHQLDRNRFNRLICDEAHWAAADSWRRILEYFGAFDKASGCKIVGFTATMERTDKRGLGEIWDEVVFQRDTQWAISKGFLVPVRAKTVRIPGLDLSQVRVQNGDLAEGSLGKAMAQAKAGPLIAQAYGELCRDEHGELRRGILFAPTVETAESFLLDFRAAGIPTELVVGTTPRAERQAKYAATAAGTNKVLASVGVLITGFDLPPVEICVMARPTKSRVLYTQAVGRVLRPSLSTGKKHAFILDVVGASRLGLASFVDLRLDEPVSDEEIDLEFDELGSPIMTPRVLPDVPEEIEFKEVNPFDGMDKAEVDIRKRILRRHNQIKQWDVTDGGIPFLPPSQTFPYYVFLFQRQDGRWQVGQAPQGSVGRTVLVGDDKSFPEAVEIALDFRGPIVTLAGLASDAQLALLARMKQTVTEQMSKNDAARVINRIFASKKLD